MLKFLKNAGEFFSFTNCILKSKRGQAIVEFTVCLLFLLGPFLVIVFKFPELTNCKLKTQEASRLLWSTDKTYVQKNIFPSNRERVTFNTDTFTIISGGAYADNIGFHKDISVRRAFFPNQAIGFFDVEGSGSLEDIDISKIPLVGGFLVKKLGQKLELKVNQPLFFTESKVNYNYGQVSILPGNIGPNIQIGTNYPIDKLTNINQPLFMLSVIGKYYVGEILELLTEEEGEVKLTSIIKAIVKRVL